MKRNHKDGKRRMKILTAGS